VIKNRFDIIQNFLLPPRCILCGHPGVDSQDICCACYDDLVKNQDCCDQCGYSFDAAYKTNQRCGQCLKSPPAFDKTYAPFIYQYTLRYLITQLKFHRQYKNARLLGYILATQLKSVARKPEIIIPVPLHPIRYKERGFNQSFEIAKTVSKLLDIPIDHRSCLRQRNTRHQIDLPAKQRHDNIKQAFSLKKPIIAKHIAILDDVMTTGSTVNELARLLKKSGIAQIDIWVCGRTKN